MISVCLATFNGERFLVEQVESILRQLGPNDELIVSDNGSTDSTMSILQDFADDRIQIFSQATPGVVENFSNALSNARGEVIFLADQDDVWIEGKVTKVLEALNRADLVLHDALVVDSSRNILAQSLFRLNSSSRGFWRNLRTNSYVGCCMAFRRSLLRKGFPIPSDVGMHDWWFGLIGEMYYKVMHLNMPLIEYRRHGNNVSNTTSSSDFRFVRRVGWRLMLLVRLFGRR